MRILSKLIFVSFLTVLLAGTASSAQAGSSVVIGGYFGPGWGWYDPWYDPWWYGPSYYYYPPNYGYLKTKIEPEQAEVWVDNKYFGIADDFNSWFQDLKLPLGIHTAQFRLKGYKTYTISFTITPGDTTKVSKELTPVPEGEEEKAVYGTLNVTAPPDASIYIDDVYSGTTSGEWGRNGVNFPLPPGRHSLRVSKEGYEDYNAVALVSPDKTINVNVEMKKAGE